MALAANNLGIQRRLVELGRIRLGDKGTKGQPQKLTKFRLTSASRPLLEAAGRIYGGTVRAWQGAPDDGYWELYTETDALDIMVPPVMTAYSQLYEIWDAGGCTLRCDGTWESIAQEPCSHGEHEDMRVTTRVSVILPKLPGLGTWRLETHGWNAAATLPASLDMLSVVGRQGWVPAILRLQQESSKKKVNGRSQTLRYVVPVVDVIGVSFGEMLASGAAEAPAIEGGDGEPQRLVPPGPSRPPRGTHVARPALGPAPALPETSDFRKPERPAAPAAPPAVVSGWAVEEAPPASEPRSAPEEPEAPDDTAPTRGAAAGPAGGGEAKESAGMSNRDLMRRAQELRYTGAETVAIARELFEGYDPQLSGGLTPEQRGQLAAELEKRRGDAAAAL